jgi:citrate lyase subunit beta/citryl-CoA lyase
MPNNIQLCRSILFVPGSVQKRIDKAASIPADAIVFDLEDAVSPSEKIRARERVVDALKSSAFNSKQMIVRVNGISTPWFKNDVNAIVAAGGSAIMLPKCESAEDVLITKSFFNSADIPLFVIIETAKGVLAAPAISNALTEQDSVCFGHVDFAADMALNEANASEGVIYHSRCQVALAARAFGASPIDNVCLDIADEQAIREDTLAGLKLGYAGKLCIHPNQVNIVNAVYTPTHEEVDKAKAILAAWDVAQEEGSGVFTFQNKMIDLPVIRAQQNILMRYQAAQ